LTNIANYKLTNNLEDFTIIIDLNLRNFEGNVVTLLGNSGCGCYAITLN